MPWTMDFFKGGYVIKKLWFIPTNTLTLAITYAFLFTMIIVMKSPILIQYLYPSTALGVRGTSRFTVVSPVTQMWVCVRPSVRVHVCAKHGDHGQDLELINLLWPWLNFHGHYVSKLILVSIDKTFNWITFCELASIFKVTRSHYVSNY